jgi:hypothetical protein
MEGAAGEAERSPRTTLCVHKRGAPRIDYRSRAPVSTGPLAQGAITRFFNLN